MKRFFRIFFKILAGIAIGLFILFLVDLLFDVSSLARRFLSGPDIQMISDDELESGDIRSVTEKEEKSYQEYAQKLQKKAVKKLDSEQKEIYEICLILPDLMRGLLDGSIEPNQETISGQVKQLLSSANPDKGFSDYLPDSLFTVTACAADDPYNFDAAVFHNLSEALYMAKDYDLATVLAALTAVNAPNSDATANLLGNLLKQNDDPEEALKMYEYALRCDSSNEAALIGAGNVCLDLKEYDTAARYFNRALSLSGGGGPANQGMMLVSFARKDEGSAFLYMIEGAKEGYTSVLTDAYAHFRRKFKSREEYLDFCGPILDQYGFRNLTDFTRTRLAFDPTLDTPAQQLTLDRTFSLPADGSAVFSYCLVSLYDGTWQNMAGFLNTVFGSSSIEAFLQNGDISALFSNPTYQYLAAESGYNLTGLTESAGDLLNTLSDGNASLTDKLLGTWETLMEGKEALSYTPASSIGSNGDNYEQEVFWLRILQDYTEYKFLQISEKYCTSLEEQFFYGPLDDSLARLDTQTAKLAGGDMAALIHMLTCFITNGSPIATREYTQAEVERFGAELCGFIPYLKKGYLSCVVLAEEYWLYTNNILGMIADDGIYNRMRANRDYTAVRVFSFFPMMAGTYFGSIGITTPVWSGVTWDWNMNGKIIHSVLEEMIKTSNVAYPKFPELPVSGMGTTGKPKIVFEVVFPDPGKLVGGIQGGTASEDGPSPSLTITVQTDGGTMVQTQTEPAPTDPPGNNPDDGSGGNSGSSSSNGSGTPTAPPASQSDGTTIEESDGSGLTVHLELGDIVEFSFNTNTLAFDFSVNAKVAGAKLGYDPVTDDITVYVQSGLDFSNQLGAEGISVDISTQTSVVFLKGTLRTSDLSASSVETGATVGAQFLDQYGFGATMSYDLISGVTKDTAHLLIDGKKTTQETSEKTGDGLLEIFDLEKWFK